MKVSLVIPFKNEEEYAIVTMKAVYSFMISSGYDFELVAVDDSNDRTWDILNEFQRDNSNVIVVKGGDPPGYGKALRKGFESATGDIYIPFNGDMCDDLADVKSYIDLIHAGYDMVFGSRYAQGGAIVDHPSSKSYLSRTGNAFFAKLFNTDCTDITNTFKGYRASVVKEIAPQASGYDLGLELALKAIRKNFKYKVIPITWHGRTMGVSKMSMIKSLFTHLKTGLMIFLFYR